MSIRFAAFPLSVLPYQFPLLILPNEPHNHSVEFPSQFLWVLWNDLEPAYQFGGTHIFILILMFSYQIKHSFISLFLTCIS